MIVIGIIFITTYSSNVNEIISNFYFLNTLFIKSLIIENLSIEFTFLLFFSFVIVFIKKEKLQIYSFFWTSFFISSCKY